MPNVNVVTSYRLFLGGHHRRQNGGASYVDLILPTTNQQSGIATPGFFSQLPYGEGEATVLCKLMYWNVVGSANPNHTAPPSALMEPIGSTDMTITAWYAPPGGIGGEDTPAVEADTFSIDADDFVDIYTGSQWLSPLESVNPASAHGAGPQGIDNDLIFTKAGATTGTMVATLPGDSSQQFVEFVSLEPGVELGGSRSFNEAAAADGIVIASYRNPHTAPPRIDPSRLPREGWVLFGGVTFDGGGFGIPIGGGTPVPIDPWGPALMDVLRTLSIYQTANRLASHSARAAIQRYSLDAAIHDLGALQKQIGSR
ncbi:MAG: hypothetical protein JWQ90_4991 [Hydrocarboniphaga sp.]|uniref:hypothetical protein n=1 Tax=Hydrocarboniphaga sp. TaxID=2033016 RepID=UPI002618A628|nr:hypothetical protein [Hydrocarboniphaga sp.]MDB5972541.1 hypothetical protein [Hydrocarboniphaga sp.]